MNHVKIVLSGLHVIWALLCLAVQCLADEKTQSQAAVAVAQAQVEIANQKPNLPSSAPGDAPPRESQGLATETSRGRDAPGSQSAPFAEPIDASVIVRILDAKGNGGVGAGTIVRTDEDGSYILTCEHVGRGFDDSNSTIEFKGKTYPIRLVRAECDCDLALYFTTEKLESVQIAKSLPSDNAEVFSIAGTSVSKPMKYVDLNTYNKARPTIITDGFEPQGRSGGGLFYGGKLIGVIESQKRPNRSEYIALDCICDFLAVPTLALKDSAVPMPLDEPKIVGSASKGPMSITFSEPAASGPPSPIEVTMYTDNGCNPCQRMHQINGNGDDRISYKYVNSPPPDVDEFINGRTVRRRGSWPMCVWRNGAGELTSHEGYITTDALFELMNKEKNNPPSRQSYAASGPGGTIHASSQIQSAMDYFRKYVGEGNSASMVWDRNGAGQISLLARQEWTAQAIFGTFGEIQLSAPSAIDLPFTEVGFKYKIVGRDLIIDADAIKLAGMVDKLGLSKVANATGPYGIIGIDDALEIYWIFSAIRDIASILWPSVDLTLPGQIAADAMLSGDTLTVNFTQPPRVKISFLFRFDLGVRKVTIQPHKVTVDFSGSSWIKQRSFDVQ